MFNSNIYVSSELTGKLVNVAQELALRVVRECGHRYNFDAEEAIEALGLSSVEVVHSRKVVSKKERVEVVKASFPLPFNGECNDNKCCGLRQNNGLYTQCQVARKGEKRYCKTCQSQADNNDNGKPDYGTIEDRLAVDIFDYVDPRGNRPVGYKKIMKKLKITEEEVLEEAGKLNIIINMQHFCEVEEPRRGRKANPLKEVKVKAEGKKGRPKKTKKVLEIEGESEDLFASLVASASSVEEEEEVIPVITTPVLPKKAVKSVKSDEDKEAERLKKEAEKAEKEAKLAAEKAEKEAKLAAKKAEKEAKLAAEKAEKEAKLAAEKAEKEAKLAAEKAEKEAKKEAEKAEKEAKAKEAAENKAKAAKNKPSSPKKVVEEEEEEADVVKKIEFEGKKYLKSKKSGIVYDYKKYVEEEEQVVVGKWNEEKSKIDFVETEEEEEEDYEE
jgi:hypothetical protein